MYIFVIGLMFIKFKLCQLFDIFMIIYTWYVRRLIGFESAVLYSSIILFSFRRMEYVCYQWAGLVRRLFD